MREKKGTKREKEIGTGQMKRPVYPLDRWLMGFSPDIQIWRRNEISSGLKRLESRYLFWIVPKGRRGVRGKNLLEVEGGGF